MAIIRISAAALLLIIFASWAAAQAPAEDPTETARLQFGPLGLTPTAALTNFGIDSNVFNTVADPKKDFTATLSPQLNGWLRAGRSRTSVEARADLVYFAKYTSERSVDGAVNAKFEVPGNRLTPWASIDYARARQRADYEIDLRSRRVTTDVAFGVEGRIAAKTRLELSAARTAFEFDGDAVFLGSNLHETLTRTSGAVTLTYRQDLTVLTTFVAEAEARRDRFQFSPFRDADSVRVQGGFDLSEHALISGRVRVGYRKFDGIAGLPRYSGVVASAASGFSIAGRARVDLKFDRDVAYSFESTFPYYVVTGGLVTVTPRLTQTWDVQARGGGQRLAYRSVTGSIATADRVDRYTTAGGGVGYYLGPTLRLGLNLDQQRRSSPFQIRDYTGYRVGVSVTYGQ